MPLILTGIKPLQAVTLVIMVFSSISVSADEMLEGADPITITITQSRNETDLTQSPMNVQLIGDDKIKNNQSASIQSLLSTMPGIFTDRIGASGGTGSLYLRGGDPNFTAIRIDGVQVNNPTNNRGGSFDLTTLGVADVENVEVISGPLSALYGSDALSGAINIKTKGIGNTLSRQVDSGIGQDGYRKLYARSSGPLNQQNSKSYAVSASYVDAGEPVEGDNLESQSVSVKYASDLTLNDYFNTNIRYQSSDATSFPDDSGGPGLAEIRELEKSDETNFSLSALYDWRRKTVDHTLNVNLYRATNKNISPGVAPGVRDPFGIPENTSRDKYQRYQLLYNSLFPLREDLSATLGFDLLYESGDSNGEVDFDFGSMHTAFDMSRATLSAIAGVRFSHISGINVHGALRALDPESLNTELIPTLGLLYNVPETGLKLKANFSEGFKLPSFFALGNSIVGNAELKPEKSRGAEIGFDYAFNRQFTLSGSVFKTEYKNLIDLETGPPPGLVNRSRVITKGTELILSKRLSAETVADFYFSYLDADIVDSDDRLRNRPRLRAGLFLNWMPRDDVVIGADFNYVDERFDSSIPTGEQMLRSYYRADFTGRWQINKRYFLAIEIDNVFDQDYQDAIGFPAPGRRMFISLGYKR